MEMTPAQEPRLSSWSIVVVVVCLVMMWIDEKGSALQNNPACVAPAVPTDHPPPHHRQRPSHLRRRPSLWMALAVEVQQRE